MKGFWIVLMVVAMATAFACSTSSNPSTDVLPDTVGDPGVDTPTDPGPGDVPAETCQRACTGKMCGNDGCGSTCGTCDPGKTCTTAGQCETCATPTTWGPIGMVATAAFPKDTAVVEAKCADFTGDTKGDSALATFADQLNPQLQAEITKGFYGAVAEFVGVTDWASASGFTFNAMAAGTETTGSTQLYVNPKFYNPANCQPYIQATDAQIAAGKLTVGPKDLSMSYTFQGMDLAVTLKSAMVKGTITHSADGVTLTDGVATGYVTKDVTDALVTKLKARCAAANPPGWCSNAGLFDLIPAAFDLDLNNDGTKDAASLCVQFTLKPAKILGYGVEN